MRKTHPTEQYLPGASHGSGQNALPWLPAAILSPVLLTTAQLSCSLRNLLHCVSWHPRVSILLNKTISTIMLWEVFKTKVKLDARI